MIGIITKNNILKNTLLGILSEFQAEEFSENQIYRVILTTEPLPDSWNNAQIPVISLGVRLPQSHKVIQIPVHPQKLIQEIRPFLITEEQAITFENAYFIFQENKRLLTIKKSQDSIALTEKENQLLKTLADSFPNAVSKEDLLTIVWNYKPGLETHTVESHIYTLRQKVGNLSDSLIESTPTGYCLIKD
jgi:DNA-binding winged helix-turn-helix (wHTH) protein